MDKIGNCYLCNKPDCERVLYAGDIVNCCAGVKEFLCIDCDTYWSSSSKRLDELFSKVKALHRRDYHYPVDLA